jgi:signal transduction histidine kinase
MTEEKRRESAGRVASAIALPEWPLRRKLALALTIPMLLAATFGGLRVHTKLAESDNYSATAKQIQVLRPAAGYLAAAERAIIISRQRTALDDPGRVSAIQAVEVAGKRLAEIGKQSDLTATQQKRLDSVISLSAQLRDGKAYVSSGQAVSQVRQLQRGVTELVDAIVVEQIDPEPKLAALQQALDGRVSLAMQQYMVNVADPKQINLVDLSAELGVEQIIIDRLGSFLGTDQLDVQKLNQQNASHFGVVRNGDRDLGDAEAFEAYDDLSVSLLDDIDKNLTGAASDARGLAIANAVITIGLLLAAIFLALLVSRMLLNPIRRVRDGALEVATTRLPEMVAKIRSGGDPGEITPIPVHTHEEMGQLARAVDDMHRQAVHLASGEARLRSQVGDMFSTLSRRNTSLINQQLGLIERLEKDEEDPNRLESLFRLDHLASRMRRTADSLMVLADAPVQSGDSDALGLGDVFQAAMAGVQEYQRVQIESAPAEKVNGAAASEVVHLMTELVDNALAFSPPTAPVKISTKQAGDSVIVEISDGGLGIAQDVLNSLNEDLRSGGEVTVETARRMGLLVVSRLANRHGITVSLARNQRGGTTATVLLPPALLRGRPTQVQPKSRPGLAGLTPAKSVLPASVTEKLTNDSEPTRLPTRPAAAAPATPAVAAPAANAAPAAHTAPAAPVEEPAARSAFGPPAVEEAAAQESAPEVGFDSISAAINAVTRLPQRQPGASRSGGAMPGAPVASTGGSLFQRLKAKEEAAEAAKPGLPQREPATPTTAFDAIEVEDAPAQPVVSEVEAPVAEPAALDLTPFTPALTATGADNGLNGHSDANDENGAVSGVHHDATDFVIPSAQAPAESRLAPSSVIPAPAPASAPASAPAPAPVTAYDLLDSRSPLPEPPEDETPIFRNLRSNWLTADGKEGTWTTSEIEAGWEAAEQVAEAPTLQLSESGLPMRRPGKRLVPGGVSPAPANVARDPEAIRARLAAHAAGVTRGRTASVDEPVSAPSNEEGPA